MYRWPSRRRRRRQTQSYKQPRRSGLSAGVGNSVEVARLLPPDGGAGDGDGDSDANYKGMKKI